MKINFKDFFHFASSCAPLMAKKITQFTKVKNAIKGSTIADALMDAAKGGWHRIKSGHDISFLPDVLKEYAKNGDGVLAGTLDFSTHMAKDAMSPNGVPIFPKVGKLVDKGIVNNSQATKWLCFNSGKVFTGVLSGVSTGLIIKELNDAKENGTLTGIMLVKNGFYTLLTTATSIACPNPFSLGAGVVGIAGVGYYTKEYLDEIPEGETVSRKELIKQELQNKVAGAQESFLNFVQTIKQRFNPEPDSAE